MVYPISVARRRMEMGDYMFSRALYDVSNINSAEKRFIRLFRHDNLIRNIIISLLLSFFSLLLISCSGNESPIEINPKIDDEQKSEEVANANREIIAVYDAMIDSESKTFTVTPSERLPSWHAPLSKYYSNVLSVVDFGSFPMFWADIKIMHPMPGSGVDVYDPRVIAIVPYNSKYGFDYPIFNAKGNSLIVDSPDGFTKLFDQLDGPGIPGNTNPFKAYFKNQPYRTWSSTGITEDTQRWYVNLDAFDGPATFKLVVDISTNYPNASQPIIDNAPEPVKIDVMIDSSLTPHHGEALIEVTFLDWQGYSNIKCKVESPQLFNGAKQLFYTRPGPNPDEYVFSATITNELHAPGAGYHGILIAAWDIPTDVHVFQDSRIFVQEEFYQFDDVTPPWLNFYFKDIYVDEKYAYGVTQNNCLCIFNIEDPDNPFWVNTVADIGNIREIQVSDGYAYLADDVGLLIVDVDPPTEVNIVKTVDASKARSVSITNGYAYVACDYSTNDRVFIIDIDPIQDACVVSSVNIAGSPYSIFTNDDYAYVASYNAGIYIIDINPPTEAYVVKTVDTPGYAYDVKVSNGYAYVADGSKGLQIIDVDPPSSAAISKTLALPDTSMKIELYGSHVYIVGYDLCIINIDPPMDAYVEKIIEKTGPRFDSIYISNGYAYVTDSIGIRIIDIEPTSDAHIVNTIHGIRAPNGIQIHNGYVYAADYDAGLKIADIDPISNAQIVSNITFPFWDIITDVAVSNDYAYTLHYESGNYYMSIVDINPPEDANLIKTITISDSYILFSAVCYQNGYIFVSTNKTIYAIDVDPPAETHIVRAIEPVGAFLDMKIESGYGYVAAGTLGLLVLDIDPPEDMWVLKTVYESGINAQGVCVDGDYAYLANYAAGILIIDINPLPDAHIVARCDTPGYSKVIEVDEGYAYVADHDGGAQIIDVFPLSNIHIVRNIGTNYVVKDIKVLDDFLYMADSGSGVKIYQLR